MRFDLDVGGGDLYEQIAAVLRRAIDEGEYGPGDRLPPARELAEGLDVNFHTVRRAFGVLVDEGVIEVRRGRGATVIASPDRVSLARLARVFVAEGKRFGYDMSELRSIFELAAR